MSLFPAALRIEMSLNCFIYHLDREQKDSVSSLSHLRTRPTKQGVYKRRQVYYCIHRKRNTHFTSRPTAQFTICQLFHKCLYLSIMYI